MLPRNLAERLRSLASDLAAPDADPLAISRQISGLASQIEHALAEQARRSAYQPTPARVGLERLWTE